MNIAQRYHLVIWMYLLHFVVSKSETLNKQFRKIQVFERHEPLPEALDALVSNETGVVVEENRWYWSFVNSQNYNEALGFIFYMGAFIDERSYAPLVRNITEAGGYSSFLLKLPMDFPMGKNALFHADKVVRDYKGSVRSWVVGGHSQGGSIASNYAKRRRNEVRGLVLLASTPTKLYDVSNLSYLQVVSLWGTNDDVSTRETWEKSKELLPENANFVEIEGGNHAYMGYYVDMGDDDVATITREEQQEIVRKEILELFQKLEESM